MRRNGLSGSLALAASVAMMLTLSVQPVLADTELGHKGFPGKHSLTDTSDKPGATCKYVSGALAKIVVRPPKVRIARFPRGLIQQQVVWAAYVQAKFGQLWFLVSTNGSEIETVTPGKLAPFTSMTVSPPYWAPDYNWSAVRVVVVMGWYVAGSGSGSARHRVDRYRLKRGTTVIGQTTGSCPRLAP